MRWIMASTIEMGSQGNDSLLLLKIVPLILVPTVSPSSLKCAHYVILYNQCCYSGGVLLKELGHYKHICDRDFLLKLDLCVL
jgi:hypothetical protein